MRAVICGETIMWGWMSGDDEERGAAAWRTLMAGLSVAWQRVQAAAGFVPGGPTPDPDPRLTAIFAGIEAQDYDHNRRYSDANEAELRLTAQLPRAALEAKGAAFVTRALRLSVPDIDDMKAEFAAARADGTPAGTDAMREVLIEVLRATHTRYADRRSNRNARNAIAWRLALVAVCVVILPLVLVMGVYWGWKGCIGLGQCNAAEVTFFAITGKWHLLALIYCGAVGAIFSRLIAFQSYDGELTYEDLHRSYKRRMILVRVFIGGIAAFVVYYLIASGIIGGDLFPKTTNNSFGPLWSSHSVQFGQTFYTMPTPVFAKLVIWCFLAGFSERFIPDQLAQVESNAGSSAQGN
jgi:hypothetical protein